MQVKEVLDSKGYDILTIRPDDWVYDAIAKMADYNVGALLVMENTSLKGIISERDYRNKVILKGKASKTTKVHEIMTQNVFCVKVNERVDSCLAVMTDKKIRHLPIMDDDNHVVGMVSIGDLVKAVINKQKVEIATLQNYISGGYPG